MKALLLEERMRLSYVDLPDPEPGPGEVVVGVRACGICGSDVHGIDGSTGRRTPPLVMGHEAAGVVEAVGPGVEGWHAGDRVAFDSTLHCGACPACAVGATNLCEHRRVVGAAFGGVRTDGAFADLVALPARALVRLPDGLAFERAAFAEPLAVALHAVGLAGVGPGTTAAVVGTGIIGLLVVQALRVAGVGRVVGIDLDEHRLELARRLGATDAVNAGITTAAHLARGLGVDVAVEAVGSAAAIRTAMDCARSGGRVVVIGNLTPAVELALQELITRELTLVGSCAFAGELRRSVELLADGSIDVAPLISAVAPLAEGAAWFRRLYAAEPGLLKVILQPGTA